MSGLAVAWSQNENGTHALHGNFIYILRAWEAILNQPILNIHATSLDLMDAINCAKFLFKW
jgi:hypothetical protein